MSVQKTVIKTRRKWRALSNEVTYVAPDSNEVWKECIENPGYSVSNYGRVRNDKTSRILKNLGKKSEYIGVFLPKTGRIPVKRLVATAFLPLMPSPDHKIHHLDFNSNNCSAPNLMWATSQEIRLRMVQAGRVRSRRILKTSKDGTETIYDSITDAAFNNGLSIADIYVYVDKPTTCAMGNTWTSVDPAVRRKIAESQPGETWIPIPDSRLNGIMISTIGRVKDQYGYLLTARKTKQGYISISIRNRNYRLHRLIALVTQGNSTLPVDHVDSVKDNNHPSNLHYVTAKQNAEFAVGVKVLATCASTGVQRIYPSYVEAAKHHQLTPSTIRRFAEANAVKFGYRWQRLDTSIAVQYLLRGGASPSLSVRQ